VQGRYRAQIEKGGRFLRVGAHGFKLRGAKKRQKAPRREK